MKTLAQVKQAFQDMNLTMKITYSVDRGWEAHSAVPSYVGSMTGMVGVHVRGATELEAANNLLREVYLCEGE